MLFKNLYLNRERERERESVFFIFRKLIFEPSSIIVIKVFSWHQSFRGSVNHPKQIFDIEEVYLLLHYRLTLVN